MNRRDLNLLALNKKFSLFSFLFSFSYLSLPSVGKLSLVISPLDVGLQAFKSVPSPFVVPTYSHWASPHRTGLDQPQPNPTQPTNFWSHPALLIIYSRIL